MKRLISSLILALGFLAVVPMSAQGQKQSCCCDTCSCGQCCGEQQCAQKPDLFAGIDLTDAQRAALDSIPCPQRDRTRCAARDRRTGRQCCDTVPTRAERRQECQDNRREYLARVKAILTPEQYTQFLENLATSQPPRRRAEGTRNGGSNCSHHRGGHHPRTNR